VSFQIAIIAKIICGMTNSKELFQEVVNKITMEDRSEAVVIAYHLLEEKLGITRNDILLGKATLASIEKLSDEINRINSHEPIQYITGTAWFRNRRFKVNPSVLIPRPETELLVDEVINHKVKPTTILDVGTGSGCIAISLALEIPDSNIFAIDVSEQALAVAKENTLLLKAQVKFTQADFLKDDLKIPELDFLVSNPPYVMNAEKQEMNSNVLNHEPHLALFVPDSNPLLFYKALAEKGKSLLKQNGKVIAEINPLLAKETKQLFEQINYKNVNLIKDLEGKDRIVIATR
jgi:release factor glutamine methyltransferase